MAAHKVHGEVEFEFRENQAGDGEFLACGQVLNTLNQYLLSGQINEAASFLAACAENVGDDLIRESLAGGASPQLVGAMAKMFYAAKDYGRAAACAERVGDKELEAACREADDDLERAAQWYESTNEVGRAAELYARGMKFAKAAELYVRAGDSARAAECFEKTGDFFRAGQLYVKLTRWDKAANALQSVSHDHPHRPDAVKLLGRILEGTGNIQVAMAHYADVIRTRPIDDSTLEIHERLAEICQQQSLHKAVIDISQRVLARYPDHFGARQWLSSVGGQQESQPAGGLIETPSEEIHIDVVDKPPPAEDEGLIPEALKDAPANLSLSAIAPVQEIASAENRIVAVDRDFEFLQNAPIFEELSLDEMKHVHNMCEKRLFPAASKLIVQGKPGEALYVIVSGKVGVKSTTPDGGEKWIGELGPGAHLGEMSLIDDAPTSATVEALEPVVGYRLLRDRFVDLIRANERIQLRIYRVLVGTLAARLREANAKLAAQS